MLGVRRRAVIIAAAVAIFALPGGAHAGEPPNPNDPCSSGGRNTCGTTGTGFYANYRYGLRWFGDFRGVVPNERHTYCIDLRYWYPHPGTASARTVRVLRNRDGETVSLENRRRLAYAIWEFGRTVNPNQAAAVMLYVHALMGDARPGEVDPAALNAGARRPSRASPATRRAPRPLPAGPVPGACGSASRARPRSASSRRAGSALPELGAGAGRDRRERRSRRVRTNANGVATVSFTATSADDVRVTAGRAASPRPCPASSTPDHARRSPERPAACRRRLADRHRLAHDGRGEVTRRRLLGRRPGRAPRRRGEPRPGHDQGAWRRASAPR